MWQCYLERNENVWQTGEKRRRVTHTSHTYQLSLSWWINHKDSTSHLKPLLESQNQYQHHSLGLCFPSLSGHDEQLWLNLDSCSGVRLRLMALLWSPQRRCRNCLPALSALKMQFDLSPGLCEAHLQAAISAPFTTQSPTGGKKGHLLIDVLYGFILLWFQIVVCFVALIFLILCAALFQSPSVVWKLMVCFLRKLKAGPTERFSFSFFFFNFYGAGKTALFIVLSLVGRI